MNKVLLNTLKQSPGVLGAALLLTNAALATEATSEKLANAADPASITIEAARAVAPSGQNTDLQHQANSESSAEQLALSVAPDADVAVEPTNLVNGESPTQMEPQTVATAQPITSPKSEFVSASSEASVPLQTAQASEFQVAQMEAVESPETQGLGLEQINEYSEVTDALEQVTSVSQLSDVQPTDWAFQALQSLVERYGCIAGYPDGTYKGNRAMTRYEFAAGLNACLERVNELIAASVANLVTREDLAVLQRLQEEFAAELATLRGRVYALEARTAELEANQFSTTTKLRGEVIFWMGDAAGDRATNNVVGNFAPEDSDPTEAYFGYRARLNFDTSFTGQDLLRTRLEAKSIPNLANYDITNTLMSRTAIDGVNNGIVLDDLYYRFPVSNGKGQVYVGANGLDLDDIYDYVTPFGGSGDGAVSRFGRYNPTTFRGPEGTGVALKYAFNDKFKLNLGYLASQAEYADQGRGLFNGGYSTGLQLLFNPSPKIGVSLEYNHRYFSSDDMASTSSLISGGTGSWIANRPFGDNSTTTENLGFQANWRLSKNFELGGWFGSTWADQKQGGNNTATIINWAVTLAFPDVFKEGGLGGLIVGMPPQVTSHDISALEDKDTSIHIEGFYRYPINDYIAITPGFYVVTNPDHNSDNSTIVVGTLRTQFRF
ncbi:iron uptake porin [Planktothrix mougeotii]|uniref:Carbohydrate porin n=1 Tax=Planktothrix mougeotii LEGE 06226 TaxID=1828728 RepID=A0ABR9UC47_9CYAN|nr:iron uptake porin [Planktothrix mougeotii]MBE9144040.1 carbohydrate porin [Planktothrix mougeotii LEGE 06226]